MVLMKEEWMTVFRPFSDKLPSFRVVSLACDLPVSAGQRLQEVMLCRWADSWELPLRAATRRQY